jgi:hypothetical protein
VAILSAGVDSFRKDFPPPGFFYYSGPPKTHAAGAGKEACRPPSRPGPIRHSLKSPGGMSAPAGLRASTGLPAGQSKRAGRDDPTLGTFLQFLRHVRPVPWRAHPPAWIFSSVQPARLTRGAADTAAGACHLRGHRTCRSGRSGTTGATIAARGLM